MVPGLSLRHPHVNRGVCQKLGPNLAEEAYQGHFCVGGTWASVWLIPKSTDEIRGLEKSSHLSPEAQAWRGWVESISQAVPYAAGPECWALGKATWPSRRVPPCQCFAALESCGRW